MNTIITTITNSAIEVIVGALIGGIISYIVSKWHSRNKLEKDIAELRLSIELANNSLKKEIDSLKQAQASELRNTIRTSCKLHIKEGWIPLDEKQDIMSCYESYEKIVSSNGVIDDCIKQMRELPNEEPV